MPQGSELITEQFTENMEAWKPDHERVKECWKLEDLIEDGLCLYQQIRQADEHWSRKVLSGNIEYDADRVRAIRDMYIWWLAPCDEVLKAICTFEEQNLSVKGSGEFRKARNQAINFTRQDVESLIEATTQAIRGESVPLSKFSVGFSIIRNSLNSPWRFDYRGKRK